MKALNAFTEVFRVFRDKEAYFEQLNERRSAKTLFGQILVICLLVFVYGAVMGTYHSGLQALSSGLKAVVLFALTILISFPSLFIIQQVLGSRMGLFQMLGIVLSGLVLMAVIAVSFVPVVLFFQYTGGNYHFLQLLHVAVFLFSGVFGMRMMLEALKFACEKKAIYPETGVTVFKVWIVILFFVSVQLAWNLRPFLCQKNEEFKVFRKHEGNFYTAIVYSFSKLLSGEESEKAAENKIEVEGYINEEDYIGNNDSADRDSAVK